MTDNRKVELKDKYKDMPVSYLIGRINGITQGIRERTLIKQMIVELTEEIDIITDAIFNKTSILP